MTVTALLSNIPIVPFWKHGMVDFTSRSPEIR